MAKQQGLHPITGTFGGINYYYHKDYGYLLRTKPGPTKLKVKRSRNSANTRRNNKEFGRASKYASLVRRGFGYMSRWCKDKDFWGALMNEMREMMIMDTEHEWGERVISRYALEGFERFEADRKCLSKNYFDRDVLVEVTPGGIEVNASINLHERKMHHIRAFQVTSIVSCVDFGQEKATREYRESGIIPYQKNSYAFNFSHTYEPGSFVFHGLCIVFFEQDARTGELKITKRDHRNAGYFGFVSKAL